MLLWKTLDIADSERVFLYRRGRLVQVLEPGRHRVSLSQGQVLLQSHDISAVNFEHDKAKFMVSAYGALLSPYLDWYQLKDNEVGLLYRDEKFSGILAPGSFRAFWKGFENVRVDIIDVTENFQIVEKDLGIMGRGLKVGTMREVSQAILYTEVPDEHVGLLTVNGKIEQQLPPGSYGYWRYNRQLSVKLVDLRIQTTDVSGQEILTKDRVSLRINLSASYRVTDPMATAVKLTDFSGFVYNELQLKLREAVGSESLDDILANKDSLNGVIRSALSEKLSGFGVDLISVGVKDIILPGDMKIILNKVVEAQKEAESNLIKRREETQAMRSLHNTAKMMDGNPVLLRMKELEALERVTERVDKITVYGGLDGILTDLIKIAPARVSY